MNHPPRAARRRSDAAFAGRLSVAALLACAVAVAATAAGCGRGGGSDPAPPPPRAAQTAPAQTAPAQTAPAQAEPSRAATTSRTVPPPRVVAVDPPNGATGVDPNRPTLSVTFDREMEREGWAWVQESPDTAPQVLGDARFDASGRTNTVSVRLQPGRTYVVWINSEQIQLFEDLEGRPAIPYRWIFTTAGSPADGAGGARTLEVPAAGVPRVVALEPPDGATGVDPATEVLQVTFDRPMREGWSWVMEDPATFPTSVGDPSFMPDRKTHVYQVRLAPETTYVIWLNSDRYQMFRSAEGPALPPTRWSFSTGAAR